MTSVDSRGATRSARTAEYTPHWLDRWPITVRLFTASMLSLLALMSVGIVSVVVLLGASLISGAFLGIGNGLLQDSMKRTVAIIFGLFIIQSSLVLIQKSAWISFFRFIATEDGSKEEASASQETENVIQREVPEIG